MLRGGVYAVDEVEGIGPVEREGSVNHGPAENAVRGEKGPAPAIAEDCHSNLSAAIRSLERFNVRLGLESLMSIQL